MKFKRLTAILLAGVMTASVLTGCGINKNAAVATLGEQEISLGVVNFICRYQQAVTDDLYTQYFGEDVWNQDLYGSGSTMQETVKTQVVEGVHEMYTLKAHMSDYNVEITDEDKSAIEEAAKSFMEENSSEALDEMGADQDIVEEVLTLYTIKAKMTEAIKADADTEVSDEEANMRAYTMLDIKTDSYTDSETNSTVGYTDEEKAQLKDVADAVEAAVEDGDALEDVCEAYGYSDAVTTGTYAADNDTLDSNVKDALDSLKEGETSAVIETDTDLYIVRIDKDTDEDATESNRESIIKQRQDDLYDSVLEGWQESDGWTVDDKKLTKIDFKNRFTQTTESDTESTEAVESTEAN